MNNNWIEFEFMGEQVKCQLLVDTYRNDNSLAILLITENGELWSDFTKNLSVNPFNKADETHAYIDVNALTDLKSIIKKYKLGKEIDSISQGYSVYPLYEFNMKNVNKYKFERE